MGEVRESLAQGRVPRLNQPPPRSRDDDLLDVTWRAQARRLERSLPYPGLLGLPRSYYFDEWGPPPAVLDPFSAEAHARARTLLLSLLTPAQRAQYAKGYIEVRGQLTSLIYRVNTADLTYNIVASDDQGAQVKLCAAPSGHMPREDKLLGQVMGLRCDERRFIRAANLLPGGGDASRRVYLALRKFAYGEAFLPESIIPPEIPVYVGRSQIGTYCGFPVVIGVDFG
jgi:hypothetical protein